MSCAPRSRLSACTPRPCSWADTGQPEQMQDYLTTLLHESRRLSRLVDNVLDFARIERGDRTYQRQPCT